MFIVYVYVYVYAHAFYLYISKVLGTCVHIVCAQVSVTMYVYAFEKLREHIHLCAHLFNSMTKYLYYFPQ